MTTEIVMPWDPSKEQRIALDFKVTQYAMELGWQRYYANQKDAPQKDKETDNQYKPQVEVPDMSPDAFAIISLGGYFYQ